MPTRPAGTETAEPGAPSLSQAWPEVVTRGTLLGLIVVTPVVVMPGFTYDVFNVPKFGVLLAGLSLALGSYAVGRIRGSAPPVPAAAWVVPLALFVPLVLSWVLSPYRDWALFGQYSRLQGLVPHGVFAAFSILVAASFTGRERQLATGLATAGGLVGVGLLLGMAGISASGEASQAGTVGNSNYVGGFLAITLPVALHLWLTAPARSYGAMVATALATTGLILSYSQGGQIAALAGVGLVVGPRIGRVWGRRLSLMMAAGLAAAAVGIVAINFVRPAGGFTAGTRSLMWRTALEMGGVSPVVGRGPNTFALEGPRYRSLQDSLNLGPFVGAYAPLGIGYQTSDDPHSVPLSFFANAGLVGFAGVAVGWAWVIRRGLRLWDPDAVGVAFFAATVAYFVQALVSIDEVVLRLGFWTALAGLVAAGAAPRTPTARSDSFPGRRALVAAGLALLAAGGIWYGVGFIRADHLARQGAVHFDQGRPAAGIGSLRAALAFRDESLYRELLAGKLGLAALRAGEEGAPLIDEMMEVNAYLEELPDVGALHAYARIMSYWGNYDPSAFEIALGLYRRTGRLDPVNPLIKVETAEVLVDLGRSDMALSLLEPLGDELQGRVPEYWAALAITRWEAGAPGSAREALATAMAIDPLDCRVRLAQALVGAKGAPVAASQAPTEALNLRLACEPGLYDMFVRRLPPDLRRDFT